MGSESGGVQNEVLACGGGRRAPRIRPPPLCVRRLRLIMKTTCASAGGFQSRSALCSTVTGCAGHVQSSPNRAISPVSGWWSITPSAAVQGWGPVAPLLAGGASRRPHRAGRTQHTPSTAAQTPPQFNPQRHAGLTTWSASRSASRSAGRRTFRGRRALRDLYKHSRRPRGRLRCVIQRTASIRASL